MRVKILQEYIDKYLLIQKEGLDYSLNSQLCPVAAGLKKAFKVKYTSATAIKLVVGCFPEDNLIFEIQTPYIVSVFINNIDNENSVEPFEFELSLEGVKL